MPGSWVGCGYFYTSLPRVCMCPLDGIRYTLTGMGGGQEPGSRGLMRPVSCDQCEGLLHSLPAQQLTCVLGAFVPVQLSDSLLLALRPPPIPPTPHLLKTRPWQWPRPGECGRGSCCPQPRSAPACPASRGWHVGTRHLRTEFSTMSAARTLRSRFVCQEWVCGGLNSESTCEGLCAEGWILREQLEGL